jgi:hypothetical protein
MRGPCRVCIRELNSEANICRSTEEYKEYNRVREWVQLSAGDGHGKLVVEKELEVSLRRLSVWLEDLVTVRLFHFRYQDTTSEDWES